jgi:hypothetical protein
MTATVKEVIVPKATAPTSVAAAAAEAVERYGPGNLAENAQAIAEAWGAKLQRQTREYVVQRARLRAPTNGNVEWAEPATSAYAMWNVLLAGPFQMIQPNGPFEPHKIVCASEDAFMLVALWRNPDPVAPGLPSAANMMSPLEHRIRLHTINLNDATAGPSFDFGWQVFGGGNINTYVMPLPAGTFGSPPDGDPDQFEMNAVVDIKGPGTGLPAFAGFSTWVYDPDGENPFTLPDITLPDGSVVTIPVPGQLPGQVREKLVRFLVYS